MKRLLHLLSCERGATIVEFAFVAPVFSAMIFGVIDIARVGLTLGSLHFAAESAARYASINTSSDGTPPAASTIETYAQNVYYGESLNSNPFTYSATGCGNTVTASYTYSLAIPLAGTWSIPLAATACFP
jgi:Flp pilus assembly protein TadG